MVQNEIRTRTMVTRIDTDGIMRIAHLPGVEETLADAEENIRAGTAAWGVGPWPILVDIRRMKPLSRDVRRYYTSPEATRRVKAVAMLVHSPLSRVLANFFITMIKPNVSTRIFTDETEALAWLKGFKE
jgi:hypothetical protein